MGPELLGADSRLSGRVALTRDGLVGGRDVHFLIHREVTGAVPAAPCQRFRKIFGAVDRYA